MLTRIYHKKNELFEVDFYKDKEYQQAFDFENIKNLYIELKEGDCTPIFSLSNKLWSLNIKANIFTPTWYLGLYNGISPQTPLITLNDVLDGEDSSNVNLSKYIPKYNAVLFLSNETNGAYKNVFCKYGSICTSFAEISVLDQIKWLKDGGLFHNKITIFLPYGTESELEKAIELAKQLKEEYRFNEINLFVLHCFISLYGGNYYVNGFVSKGDDFPAFYSFGEVFNKIITTNSTGVSLQKNAKRLQIIDCYDIFNDYLQNKNE